MQGGKASFIDQAWIDEASEQIREWTWTVCNKQSALYRGGHKPLRLCGQQKIESKNESGIKYETIPAIFLSEPSAELNELRRRIARKAMAAGVSSPNSLIDAKTDEGAQGEMQLLLRKHPPEEAANGALMLGELIDKIRTCIRNEYGNEWGNNRVEIAARVKELVNNSAEWGHMDDEDEVTQRIIHHVSRYPDQARNNEDESFQILDAPKAWPLLQSIGEIAWTWYQDSNKRKIHVQTKKRISNRY